MPIAEKYPNYLGSPILLEGATFERDNFTWTNNPVNLVGSTAGKLYRHDLTKAGHPECDQPTYWEYVVDKDLEKLKQQKKQGLGSKLCENQAEAPAQVPLRPPALVEGWHPIRPGGMNAYPLFLWQAPGNLARMGLLPSRTILAAGLGFFKAMIRFLPQRW